MKTTMMPDTKFNEGKMESETINVKITGVEISVQELMILIIKFAVAMIPASIVIFLLYLVVTLAFISEFTPE